MNITYQLQYGSRYDMITDLSGFPLGRLHMGGQVQGDKALMGGLMRRDIDFIWGRDLTLIDYIIN